jgi:hypothetical protein
MTISTTEINVVNTGTTANDGTGDTLRESFQKINANFDIIGSIIGTDYGNLAISSNYVPTTAASAGTSGQLAWDDSHIYICIATNSWKRANIAAW